MSPSSTWNLEFDALDGTRDEARAVAELFEGVTGVSALLLEGRDATKSALIEQVRCATFLHVATQLGSLSRESL